MNRVTTSSNRIHAVPPDVGGHAEHVGINTRSEKLSNFLKKISRFRASFPPRKLLEGWARTTKLQTSLETRCTIIDEMSEQERRRVVEERRARNFPLHKPPHPRIGAGWYFITAACYEHRHQFTTKDELNALVRNLLEGFERASIPIGGWVVLPNHYHLLVKVDSLNQVGGVVGPVHGRSARYANLRDSRPARQVWYKYSDRKIRSERHYWACLHYIIMNPVKHELVSTPAQWPWSCYHELLAEYGAAWIEDLQREYPLLDFGKKWDR